MTLEIVHLGLEPGSALWLEDGSHKFIDGIFIAEGLQDGLRIVISFPIQNLIYVVAHLEIS